MLIQINEASASQRHSTNCTGKRLTFSATRPSSREYAIRPSAMLMVKGLMLALLGKYTPKRWIQRYFFPADLKQYQDNLDVMTKELQAQMFTLMPRPGFEMSVGYHPSKAGKPVILFAPGAISALRRYLPFLKELQARGYGVITFQRALLDAQGKHLASKKLSNEGFETVLRDDLDYLSRALESGANAAKIQIPFEQQVIMGHSAGSITAAKVVARHPERPYQAAVMVGSPLSLADGAMNLKKSATAFVYKLMPTKWATSAIRGWFDLSLVSPEQVKQPLLVINGSRDSLTRDNPKQWLADIKAKSAPVTYVELKDATHINELNQHGYHPVAAKQEKVIVQELPAEYQSHPYERVIDVLEAFLEDPKANDGKSLVRFA